MQEVFYVYKARSAQKFKLIPDRGRRLTDIEVDVSIAHQENVPLGSLKWDKVIVNPTHPMQERSNSKACDKLQHVWPPYVVVANQRGCRWESLASKIA